MDVQAINSRSNIPSYVLLTEGEELRMLYLKKEYILWSDKVYKIYDKFYKDAFLSELNIIYVALTRACDEMYIFISNKIKSGQANIVKYLIPEELFYKGEKKRNKK